MRYIDLPLDQRRAYRPELEPPVDLAAFWAATLADARRHDLAATFTHVTTGLALIDTFDVTFAGFGGDPIRAWLRLPAGADRGLAFSALGNQDVDLASSCLGQEVSQYPVFRA